MTERDLLNRKKFLFDYLELIHLYPDEFEKKHGEIGLRKEIDRILDEINIVERKLKKLNDEKSN